MTRAATEAVRGGPTEDVVLSPPPVVASYLERPTAWAASYRGQRRLACHAPLVGRQTELAVLEDALREAISGTGSVLFIVGEPGLGKTRLVDECRVTMAWVGASTGRLPLWLEGRAASYASSTPYGLYQQLLSAWVGAAPEEGEEVVRLTLEKAIAISERIGGLRDAISCRSYLAMAALRQHDVGTVRCLAPRVRAEAEAAGYPTEVGEAKATMAWVAWQDGRSQEVAANAGAAWDV